MVHGYLGDNCLLCNVTNDLPSLYNNSSSYSGNINSSTELMGGTRSMSLSSTILDRTMLRVMNNTNTEHTIGTKVYDSNEGSDSVISSSQMNRVTINYIPQLGLFSILNPIK